jgi:hypothetical protein
MSTPPLSFDRASYAGDPAGPDRCAYCQSEIAGDYYRVSGNLACNVCAQKAQSLIPPNSHGAFARALSYGAAAAVLGCIGYALVTISTGWTIGYAAIGVGWIIGWAMKRGADGNGGRRYQVAAAALTYAAVAVAFVPIFLHEAETPAVKTATVTQGADTGSSADTPGAGPVLDKPAQTPRQKRTASSTGLQIGALLLLGLVSPFLLLFGSFFHGALNLFIIFIGVRFAWQAMTPPHVEVEGPYPTT